MYADEDAILDIKNVYNLTEHVVDWFGLGTQLEITDSRLKKIRLENDSEDGRRREMIVSWLYGDPEASWEKLSKALVRVDHRVLADRIDREILPLLQHAKYSKASPRRGIKIICNIKLLSFYTCMHIARLSTEACCWNCHV